MSIAPENTSKRAPELHVLGMLDSPDTYITDMESAGQRQLVASSTLPKQGPWDELTRLGFVRGKDVDELFVEATLPAGWFKEGSDHAMHSYLLDERGVRRVDVFYKAAFYDRRADMHFVNVGYMAAIDVLYGDEKPALPPKWDVFTEDERADFVAGLDGMQRDINDAPEVYGKYRPRLAAARALLAEVSS